jgi:hypothetical protein
MEEKENKTPKSKRSVCQALMASMKRSKSKLGGKDYEDDDDIALTLSKAAALKRAKELESNAAQTETITTEEVQAELKRHQAIWQAVLECFGSRQETRPGVPRNASIQRIVLVCT